ncbi:MAG: hypothetical protein ABI564_01200 [Ideonella sp.]
MNDMTELLLGALAIVLGCAALAVGGQVIRDAWRGVFRKSRPRAPRRTVTWDHGDKTHAIDQRGRPD